MGDMKQITILKQGVLDWNIWRRENPNVVRPQLSRAPLSGANLFRVDLHAADLGKADLRGANLGSALLHAADLREADLRGANLGSANLSGADLRGANLSDARFFRAALIETNLIGAKLVGTDLTRTALFSADLREADLRGAKLSGADLSGANLNDANLSDADLFETNFGGSDLRRAKGLAELKHLGSCYIDLHAIQLSQDESALHFLRGVGMPEPWIEFWRTQETHSVQYHSFYISYSSTDEMLARWLYADLQIQGVRCWLAPRDLHPGAPILRGVEEANHLQDKVLLILSENAVNSRWIEQEVDAALRQEIKRGQDVLFPIRLDNAVLESNAGWATRLQHRPIGDFTNWQDVTAYQDAFGALLRHLKVTEL